jgi:hypothetical protein
MPRHAAGARADARPPVDALRRRRFCPSPIGGDGPQRFGGFRRGPSRMGQLSTTSFGALADSRLASDIAVLLTVVSARL